MCQKINTMKRFFLLMSHPPHNQIPHVVDVFPQRYFVQEVVAETVKNNQSFLTKDQIVRLGVLPSPNPRAFIIPIDIPRDWFIH